MKAFLLAAGVGSRLRPLTDTIPKCLVPIRGEPLLGIWLKLLENFGITEVLVNAHANGAQVREFLRGRFPDHQVTLAEEPELLGSAGTLVANRSWIGADPSFFGSVCRRSYQREFGEHASISCGSSERSNPGGLPCPGPREMRNCRSRPLGSN